MKNNILRIMLGCTMTLLALSLSGCSDNTETIDTNYINLSADSYTFDAAGAETFTVDVDAIPSWKAETVASDWVSITPAGNQLTITVTPNELNEARVAEINFTAGKATSKFTVTQFGADTEFARYRLTSGYDSFVFSPEGVYGFGITVVLNSDNTYTYNPVIIDLATDEKTELGSFSTLPGASYTSPTASAVTDTGMPFVINQGTESYKYENGAWSVIIATYEGAAVSATIQSVSSDGTVWYGFIMRPASYDPVYVPSMYVPAKWVNGTMQILPTPNEIGYGFGTVPEQGFMARGCSTDGSVTYGSCWDNGVMSALYWDANGNWHWVAEDTFFVETVHIDLGFYAYDMDIWDRPLTDANPDRISADGSALAVDFRDETYDTQLISNSMPIFVDLNTGDYIMLDDQTDGTGLGMSFDGKYAFWGTPARGTSAGYVYDMATGTSTPAAEWVMSNYGLKISSENNYVYKTVAGGKVVLGRKVVPGMFGVSFVSWYIYDKTK